jgi:N6-L-threonylcarbamoyladenine synthase
MIILGIETSCDETAAAVIQNGQKILSNVVASSVELHQKTGGIIPEIAAREQSRCLIPVIKESLTRAKITPPQISALAITIGPGLIASLLVGVETAKTLASVWEKPLIPINHLQAHLYANWLTPNQERPKFPALGLVVSGGHTDLVLLKNHGEIKWLGGTRDDAAGECFDKCARLLGLGYPGGPAIASAAAKFKEQRTKNRVKLPRPMRHEDNFDFSFSGLKTAVLNEVKKSKERKQFKKDNINQIAEEIQEAITDVLVTKTKKAAEKYDVKSVVLAGGVTANSRLREKFKLSILSSQLFIPAPILCTDNATFIAACAFFNYHPLPWQKIQADSSLEIEEVIKS